MIEQSRLIEAFQNIESVDGRAARTGRIGHEIESEYAKSTTFDANTRGSAATFAAATKQIDAKSSLALNNLRAVTILTVLAFHSMLAYLSSLGPNAFQFDQAPYMWRAFPIIDSHRWLGFDIFCAWQDAYLMSLMFFLSALFTWPSLTRKGTSKFLADRFQRLGVPFVFALVVVMPIALWPVYRLSADDPSLAGYVRHYLALPFAPAGPMWFLWQLLALTIMAAAAHRFVPGLVERLGMRSSNARCHPGRYFVGLAIASVVAYVPLALIFTPWSWSEHGPFALQFCRPLLYTVIYFAGLGIGAHGLGRGLLAPDGMLPRQWARWLPVAAASFLLWMGLTALSMNDATAPIWLRVAADIAFALTCASGCFFMLACCLRFGAVRSRILGNLAAGAFGMYLFHYVFVVWLQYALLDLALFAIAKAGIVFAGTLLLAWATTAAMRFVPFGSQLLGASAPASPRDRTAGSQNASGYLAFRPTDIARQ